MICCFIGHRHVSNKEKLSPLLARTIEDLITKENADTFLFGSRSQFDDLVLDAATKLKEKYPHIKRVYVRAEYEHIDEQYKKYLLEIYDKSYFPESVKNSGKLAYVIRNEEMIDNSGTCVFYCNENNLPKSRTSGTKLALDYAIRKKKRVIIFSGIF